MFVYLTTYEQANYVKCPKETSATKLLIKMQGSCCHRACHKRRFAACFIIKRHSLALGQVLGIAIAGWQVPQHYACSIAHLATPICIRNAHPTLDCSKYATLNQKQQQQQQLIPHSALICSALFFECKCGPEPVTCFYLFCKSAWQPWIKGLPTQLMQSCRLTRLQNSSHQI